MKLTDQMRDALLLAKRGPMQRVHDDAPGKPPWPAHPSTLRALVARDLLAFASRRTRRAWRLDEWTITDLGRDALKPLERTKHERPQYMARDGSIRYRKLKPSKPGALGRWAIDDSGDGKDDYTSDPRRSIDNDRPPNSKATLAVEALIDPAVAAQWATRARQREAKRRRENGKQLDTLPIDDRLETIRLVAREHHMDFNREDRMLRYLIAKGRTQAATARLTLLETQLGQRAA